MNFLDRYAKEAGWHFGRFNFVCVHNRQFTKLRYYKSSFFFSLVLNVQIAFLSGLELTRK
jgi:hypothetical protein